MRNQHTVNHRAVHQPVLGESFVSMPWKDDIIPENIYQHVRSELLLSMAVPLVRKIIAKYANLHVDIPDSTKQFLNDRIHLGDNHDVMFASIHTSLWETIGLPYVLDSENLPIPYMVMGNNLVKGKIPVYFMTKLGVVVSERENKKKQVSNRESIELSRRKMEAVLGAGNFLGVYPTDGRARDGLTPIFKSNPFQAAINLNTPIVPVRPSYHEINEEKEFCKEKKKSYTFKLLHFTRWLRPMGDVYMNFGEPITPSEASTNKKELADIVRVKCLLLTPILPRNIVAYSAMQQGELRRNIKYTLERLEPFKDKFIIKGWDDTLPLDAKVDMLIEQADVLDKHPRLITFYGNQIKHYPEGMYYGKCK